VKIKLLAVAVAGILLSGCNDDNGVNTGLSVQAFDPAVQNMTAVATCDDKTTETSTTGYDGNATFFEQTILVSPETCTFTFTGGANAIDVSNGKSMKGVTYSVPKGMAQAGHPVTASPLTTLIANQLATTGETYSDETATAVLTSLGLDSLLNHGVTTTELLSNTAVVLAKLTTSGSDDASLLAATTAVLSDVLAADEHGEVTVTEIAAASTALTEQVLIDYENYPANDTGEQIYIKITPELVKDVVDNPPTESGKIDLPVPKPADPVKPPKPTPPTPTGGNGNNGGGSGS